MRAVPHLGAGVVLGVVDPGSARPAAAWPWRSRGPRPVAPSASSGPTTGSSWRRRRPAGGGADHPRRRAAPGRRRPGPRPDLRRARPLRPRCGRPVRRGGARGPRGAGRPGVAGAPRRRRRRTGPAARRPDLPARRGHLGRPLRQPPAGGDRGRRACGGHPVGGPHRPGGPHRVGRASPSTGFRRRSYPTASACAASTRSATWSTASSACSSTPTGTWPWWPARRRRRAGSTSPRGSCSSSPGERARRHPVWCRREAPRYHPTQ